MNRLPNETLIDFTLRYLRAHTAEKRFQQVNEPAQPEQASNAALSERISGGPQPIVNLLDSSIETDYSRSSGSGLGKLSDSQSDRSAELIKGSLARVSLNTNQEQEIYRKDLWIRLERANHPAPKPKSLLCTVLDLPCEVAVDDNQYGILVCKRDAVGICKHCGLPVCLSCVKWEFCCFANRHEVITQ